MAPERKIAALRRLAEDPGATEAEKENALRRIAEMEKKYDLRPKAKSGFPKTPPPGDPFAGGPGMGTFLWEIMQEMIRSMGLDEDGWVRGAGPGPDEWKTKGATWDDYRRAAAGVDGVPPHHQNARCHYEPVTGADGEMPPRHPPPGYQGPLGWIGRDWVEYKRTHPAGRYGRISRFEVSRDFRDMTTRIDWPCPRCGGAAGIAINDEVMAYTRNERQARHQIGRDLFTRFNGESDNYCSACSRHTSTVRFEGRRLSEFADYVMNRWRSYPDFMVDPGRWPKVERLERHPVTDEAVKFQWRCCQCGGVATHEIGWRNVRDANKLGPNGIDVLVQTLFKIFTGQEDNRCEKCRRKEK